MKHLRVYFKVQSNITYSQNAAVSREINTRLTKRKKEKVLSRRCKNIAQAQLMR